MKRHVIIGNSHAATTAVEWLRKVSDSDEVVLISREDGSPYSPALTTYYLSGKMSYEQMFYLDYSFYKKHNVEPLLGAGKAVVQIDAAGKAVTLADGTSVPYDDLLIATGSKSIVPSMDGGRLPGVLTLWTAEDARKIDDAAQTAKRVTVVGGGLIGIQTVNAMVVRGKQVTQIEMLSRVMPVAMDADGGKIIEARYRDVGVDLRLEQRVDRIEDSNGQKILTLASGDQVEADMVVMAVGVVPNIDFLDGAGIKVDRGIVIDDHSKTNVEGIYAAGDCAASVDAISGELSVFAIIPAATEHGRVAGLNMGGLPTARLRNLGLNSFTPLGVPCGSVGILDEGNGREGIITVNSGGDYRKLIFEGDRLVGAVLIGKPLDEGGLLASLIEMRLTDPKLKSELQQGSAAMNYIRLLAQEKGLASELAIPARWTS